MVCCYLSKSVCLLISSYIKVDWNWNPTELYLMAPSTYNEYIYS